MFHFLFVPESYFETINIKWFLFSVLLEEGLHVHEHVHVYIRTSKRSLKGTYVDAQFTFFLYSDKWLFQNILILIIKKK